MGKKKSNVGHNFFEQYDTYRKTVGIMPSESESIYQQKQALFFSFSTLIAEFLYSMFDYEGLPDGIDPLYIEMTLHRNGNGLFWKSEDADTYYFMPFTSNFTDLDYQGRPAKVDPKPDYNNGLLPLRSVVVRKDVTTTKRNGKGLEVFELKQNGVICKNTPLQVNTIGRLSPFIYDLVDNNMTARNRLNWHKSPFIYTVPEGQQLNVRKEFNKIQSHERVIIKEEMLGQTSTLSGNTSLDNNTPFINDKIRIEKNAIWDWIMLMIGIDNTNQDKTERMVTDEVNANNEQVLYAKNNFLSCRRDFCKEINELFGLKVRVTMKNRALLLRELEELEQRIGGEADVPLL